MKGKLLKKAEQLLNKTCDHDLPEANYVAIITLAKDYGWKKTRISRFYDHVIQSFDDVRKTNEISMIQQCAEECNLDISVEGFRHWSEYAFLNNSLWETLIPKISKMPDATIEAYFVKCRQDQAKWMFAIATASIMIGLHRKEKWGADRLADFYEKTVAVRRNYCGDLKALSEDARKLSGMKLFYDPNTGFYVEKERKEQNDEDSKPIFRDWGKPNG